MSVADLAEAGGEKDGVPERTHHTRLLLPQTGQDQGAELTAMRWHKVSTVLAQRHHQLVDRGANLNRITVIFTVHVCRQLCRLMVKSIHVHNLDDFQVLVDGIIMHLNHNLEAIKVMYIHECFSPSTRIIDSPLIIYMCQQHQRQRKQINYTQDSSFLQGKKKICSPTTLQALYYNTILRFHNAEAIPHVGVIVAGEFPESLLGQEVLPVSSPLCQELSLESMQSETESVETHGHNSLVALQPLVCCHHSTVLTKTLSHSHTYRIENASCLHYECFK